MQQILSKACRNSLCLDFGKLNGGNAIGHASFGTNIGASQRCLCKSCGKTFSSNTGTAYHRLRCSRDEFDQVVTMRVEGVSLSAIARITGRSRSTIARWLERAAAAAKSFNDRNLKEFEIKEMQADELWTFIGTKAHTTWLFTVIEVWSRLRPSSVIGRRSYRNTESIFNDLIYRGRLRGTILVTTDGFEFYSKVIRKLFGVSAIYGQVIKTRRNNRVIRVDRALKIGTKIPPCRCFASIRGFRDT